MLLNENSNRADVENDNELECKDDKIESSNVEIKVTLTLDSEKNVEEACNSDFSTNAEESKQVESTAPLAECENICLSPEEENHVDIAL